MTGDEKAVALLTLTQLANSAQFASSGKRITASQYDRILKFVGGQIEAVLAAKEEDAPS